MRRLWRGAIRKAGAALGWRRQRLEHVQHWRRLRALEREVQAMYGTARDARERREALGLMLRVTIRKQLCGNPRRA